MNATNFHILENNKRHWVGHESGNLGAFCDNGSHSYIFPFLTPSGVNVLQEAPPDHVHHNGIFFGQDHMNTINFWKIGPAMGRQKTDSIETVINERGVSVICQNTWHAPNRDPIASETRRLRWEVWPEGVFLEITSELRASFGPLTLLQTKEGGLGMRVHYALETHHGGRIASDSGRRGEQFVFDTMSNWLSVTGHIENRNVGVVMMPHPTMERVPWFCRDYGIHLYNPQRHKPACIPSGECHVLRVAFVACDNPHDETPRQAWLRYSELADPAL